LKREQHRHNGKAASPITPPDLAAERYENVLEAAIDYTCRGVRVTPLNGKKPTLDGWPSRMLDEEDLPRYFNNGQNVGGLLGEPSGGLVDVDLDMVQAVAAADVLLPETLEYGRKGNPRSHRLYVCDPIPAPKKYSLTKPMANALGLGSKGKVVLVELRSTGQQSVFPPSIHPLDGDEYVWSQQGELRRMDGRVLEKLVREVATAALLSLWCNPGERQEFFLAAAGYLGRHL
jgi:hypothetical protein